jgi:hypothetical protein
MAKQTINIGTSANDGTGDTLRGGFTKVNNNFTELYGKTIGFSSNNGTAVTGTLTETLSQSILIPANTFSTTGILEILARYTKTGIVGTSNLKVYKNTSNSLVGATLIFGGTAAAASALFSQSIRTFRINSNTLTGYVLTGASDYATATAYLSTTFTTNVDNYILFSLTMGSILDSANVDMVKLIKTT